MIRYEYEEEDTMFPDHKMPIVRNTTADMHPTVSNQVPLMQTEPFFAEADWLNADAPVSRQIDDYVQQFNAETFDELDIEGVFDDFQPNVEHHHHFNDSLFDSHHTSYYTNTTVEDEQIQQESYMAAPLHHDYYQQIHRQEIQPLKARDLNVPSQRHSSAGRQEKKKSQLKKPNKPPSQRRPIDEFPTKNGFKKPLFSYSCLIGLAMRNSESGELTVAEIYRFLCEHFPFFREAPSGWKNSVRHNLSLNKCFQKVEVTVPDAQGRRSCLWRINPAKLDRMASEINKWKERCVPTIELAMSNPDDLQDIIDGKKGMPPADDLYLGMSGRDDDSDFGNRSKERVIYISRMQDLNKFENQRPKTIEARQPQQYHSVPSHSKYVVRQPLRCIKQEENCYNDENMIPASVHSLPSTSSHYHQMPSTSSSSYNKLHSTSIHERAMRNLESLLERKKHTTVNPSRETPTNSNVELENQENCPPPPQRLHEQKTTLHSSRSDFATESPSSSTPFGSATRPAMKPLAIRLQRPHQINNASPSLHRQASQSPAPFGTLPHSTASNQ